MYFPSNLRRRIARLVLRGGLFRWWLRRKLNKLETGYARELLKASQGKPAAETIHPVKSAAPLRRVLFIADIMWEGRELVPELAKICEVKTFDLHPRLAAAGAGMTPDKLVFAALSELVTAEGGYEPDAILFYARASLLSEEAFDVLRKRWSCPLLGMNLDEKMEFLGHGVFSAANDDYQRWAKKFDLNLSNVRAVVDWYADRNLPVLYVPEGFHSKYAAPPAGVGEFTRELSFVGSCRPERVRLFDRLHELGVPVSPVGYGWPESQGGNNPEAIYRSSMMNLGIGFAAPSQTLTTLKTRDFECPGAGACYLTTWNWELALHYDVGREILCYRSEEELAEVFSFYRRRPEACLKIAQAGWRRCAAEHTWEARFRNVFRQMGFKLQP